MQVIVSMREKKHERNHEYFKASPYRTEEKSHERPGFYETTGIITKILSKFTLNNAREIIQGC